MRLIVSILAGFAGSLAGSATRVGVNLAERQLERAGPPDVVAVNGSLVGGLAAGMIADAVGGPRLAFWLGAVLGAAGTDRLDWWVLRKVGVDPEQMMARARDAAAAKTRGRGSRAKTQAKSEADAEDA
jgi:hypothetical protein